MTDDTNTPKTADFEALLKKRNVIAVSYDENTDTLDVWVSQKLPLATLDAEDVVANNVPAGVTTDVHDAGMGEEADGFTPELLHSETDALSLHTDRHDRHRPVLPGVSEININSTAATAGHYPARVVDPSKGVWDDSVEKGDTVRISNCHVYARSGQADLGEYVVQPSTYDGGDEDDTTGGLVGYLPLEDSVRADVAARSIDADQDTVEPHEMATDWPTAIRREQPEKGETLSKTGRTTGVTSGEVLAPSASVRVEYPHGIVTLHEQVLTEAMSAGGDSGSPVYDGDGRLLAQLYAGSPKITAHSRVDAIESDFGIQLMSSEPNEHEPEQTFEDWVEALLKERYGDANVERQVRLETDRQIDLLATDETNGVQWAIELENDSGSTLNGTGQCEHYAHRITKERPENGAGIPVLGVPNGHIDADEKQDYMERGTVVWEFDPPEEVSLRGV